MFLFRSQWIPYPVGTVKSALRKLGAACADLLVRHQRLASRPIDTTSFAPGARPGKLVTDLFFKIREIPGWFNIDDCAHFSLLLEYQDRMGLRGDILEIGSYFGRSTCLLAHHLRAAERLLVCDAFGDMAGSYRSGPSPEALRANLARLCPEVPPERVEIRRCLSTALVIEPEQRFRFAHVDGGHTFDVVLHDLTLCAQHMIESGLIVLDDYHHHDFPEVTEAADHFLAQRDDIAVLADLNRHGAIGRKLYLIRERSRS